MSELDLLLVCPGDNRTIYQDLALEYAAIEPPIWGALLANAARRRGHRVALVDQQASGLSPEQIAARVGEAAPRLVAVVVYGQQPSASTQTMTMAGEVCRAIKESREDLPVVVLGGHPSALPERTLLDGRADFVVQGEGPYTLDALLRLDDLSDRSRWGSVPGLWYREGGGAVFAGPAPVVPEAELSGTLPGMAWDLLPMKAYRAHNWHCFDRLSERQPYASLYTSLGCPFRCSFCCINAPFGKPSIRTWPARFVADELEALAATYGVRNVKIADEMFVLDDRHVNELCDRIIERRLDFNFWAYARVDTVKERTLEKLKRAGFNWLCLGIESGSKHVRDGVQKGRFTEDDIHAVVRRIKEAGIRVIGNYMFGMPDDDYRSMRQTLELALELNCEMANFYSGMAYPGSKLYGLALERGWKLPERWHDFSQHSYEQLPLPTEHLEAGEVLAFRDWAWQTYFTHPRYLGLVRRTFGQDVVDHLARLASHTLRRKHAVPLDRLPAEVRALESLPT